MKNIKIFNLKSLALVLTLLLITTSCSNWIDQDINTDPDSPADVPMNLLLPTVQQNMGYNLLGNNSVRTNNIWMQQFDGTDRQSFTEARYQLTPADTENLWTSIYAEIFINEGQTMKRWRPRAMGRAARINKRTCCVTVVLNEMLGKVSEAKKEEIPSNIYKNNRKRGSPKKMLR